MMRNPPRAWRASVIEGLLRRSRTGRLAFNYRQTVGLAAMATALTAYYVAINWFNGVPQRDQLTLHVGKIVQVSDLAPHFAVELPDGSRRWMEFPTRISTRPDRFHGIERQQKSQLLGCSGVFAGVELNAVFGNRFRVWELHCGGVHLGFDRAQEYYWDSIEVGVLSLPFFWFLCGLLIVAAIYGDRRRLRDCAASTKPAAEGRPFALGHGYSSRKQNLDGANR